MVTISKYDKKVWDNYVSDFGKTVLFPRNDSLLNVRENNKKIAFKSNKQVNNFKNFKKKN